MKQVELEKLLHSMSVKEKIGQLFQIAGHLLVEDGTVTGPMQELGVTPEDISLAGSVLGVMGADKIKEIQARHIQKHPHGIPLIFMLDIINGYRTVYPVPLAQGASFRPELSKKCAQMAAREAGVGGLHVTFSPMSDLVRDARWGRVMESTGEDVWLNSLFAEAMTKGYQGEDLTKPETLGACVKHFAGYGAPDAGRDYNTVQLSERTFREYYLPAYKAAIDAGVALVMTSFNTINDIPATVNRTLMRNVLRDEMGFDGVLISDYGAIGETVAHGLSEDRAQAAQLAMEAGVDIDMMTGAYPEKLEALIADGKVSENLLDEAVLRVLELKNKLGLFEDPFRGADKAAEENAALTKENRALAQEAAERSFVLLKNENENLPLKKTEKIAFIGPYVNCKKMLGGWSFTGDANQTITIGQAVQELASDWNITLANGCTVLDAGTRLTGFTDVEVEEALENPDAEWEKACQAAREADHVVLFLGEHYLQTGEATSQAEIELPAIQRKLLEEVAQINANLTVVIFTGRPLDLREVAKKAKSILVVWMPGTQGGMAIVRTLMGSCEPTGRLPMSFPYCVGQVPVHYDEFPTGRPCMKSNQDQRFLSRYIDVPNEPLYPFGWGLGYSSYTVSEVQLSRTTMSAGETVGAQVTVKNVGKHKGTTMVQLYIHDVAASVVRPVKQLRGYQFITLDAGQECTVSFSITEEMLKFHRADGSYGSEPGVFEVMLDQSSRTQNKAKFMLV